MRRVLYMLASWSFAAVSAFHMPLQPIGGHTQSAPHARHNHRRSGRCSNTESGRAKPSIMMTHEPLGRRRRVARLSERQRSWLAAVDGTAVVAPEPRSAVKRGKEKLELVELGTSGLMVTKAGLGGIMFGGQMDEEQTHEVLDHAFDRKGINWLDSSEMYPFPVMSDHLHKADAVIGSWLKGRDRSKIILCTKVAARSSHFTWFRKDGSSTRMNRDQIMESVEGSLKRMGTDYIDLLYLGDWPERYVQDYGESQYTRAREHPDDTEFEEQLMAVQELMEQGVVRHVGLANETPYGVTRFCEHAEWDDLPKVACVQTPYNLLGYSKAEMGLVEACGPRQNNVAMVAVSPLGAGGLTSKYTYARTRFDKDLSYRMNMFPGLQARFNTPHAWTVIKEYRDIAESHGMTVGQMALAWVYNRPFITAILMGATSTAQLDENIASLKTKLSDEILEQISEVMKKHREPVFGHAEFETEADLDPMIDIPSDPY